jgi:hypothetical protein
MIIGQDDVMAPDRIAVQYTAAVASDSDVVRLINLHTNIKVNW